MTAPPPQLVAPAPVRVVPSSELAPPERDKLTVADLAFEYGRAVCALTEIAEERKTRALTYLAETIVPLAGPLDADALTPSFCRSVARVLLSDDDEDGRRVSYLWWDFVRWSSWFMSTSRSRDFTL